MAKIQTYLPHAARVLLGLIFTVFGLNGFLHFMPLPAMPGPAGAFLGALAATGYMFPVIKGVEVVSGVLLLAHRFTPLALTLLAPIIINIALFHVFLATPDPVTVVILGLELYLAWAYRGAFVGVLTANARPEESSTQAEQTSAVTG